MFDFVSFFFFGLCSNLFFYLVVSSIFIKIIFKLYHLHFYTIHCERILWTDITLTVHTLTHRFNVRTQAHRFYWTHNFNEFFWILQKIKRDKDRKIMCLCVIERETNRTRESACVENIGIWLLGSGYAVNPYYDDVCRHF